MRLIQRLFLLTAFFVFSSCQDSEERLTKEQLLKLESYVDVAYLEGGKYVYLILDPGDVNNRDVSFLVDLWASKRKIGVKRVPLPLTKEGSLLFSATYCMDKVKKIAREDEKKVYERCMVEEGPKVSNKIREDLYPIIKSVPAVVSIDGRIIRGKITQGKLDKLIR